MNILEFIHELSWDDLPDTVRNQARRCLLDTLGAGVGGRSTDLSRIVHDFAALAFGGRGARLWHDGREVSPPGAALANGMTVDALDIHDGHMLTKGHAGAAIVPAALAILNLGQGKVSGQELLTLLVAGYEVAIRAGIVLHATVSDYHTSGAWNALGCAALTARRLGLKAEATRHALGIAEYHGPRSQMMRCIDYPTMLKDGSGWGAMAGVSAGMLAAGGFTGAPAITVEAAGVAHYWADLGATWHVLDQYFKPHATCRWAQPAVEGALAIQHAHQLRPDDIARIQITTFYEATELNHPRPATTEEAQYSLPFPVAAALFHHGLGPAALSGQALHDRAVLSLAERVELVEDPALSARFPAERVARVRIETTEGQCFELDEVKPRWEASAPPADEELREKFRWLAAGQLPQARAEALEEAIWNCAGLPEVEQITRLLVPE